MDKRTSLTQNKVGWVGPVTLYFPPCSIDDNTSSSPPTILQPPIPLSTTLLAAATALAIETLYLCNF